MPGESGDPRAILMDLPYLARPDHLPTWEWPAFVLAISWGWVPDALYEVAAIGTEPDIRWWDRHLSA